MAKLRKPISLQSKRPKFFLKAVWREKKLSLQTPISLEILKSVCLTFDWVPKLFQIGVQDMEQKLVQRCETKVDADACKGTKSKSQKFSHTILVTRF